MKAETIKKLSYIQIIKRCGKIAFKIINGTSTKEERELYQVLQKEAEFKFKP